MRDGRACAASKVRHTGQPVAAACKKWRRAVEVYRYPRGHRVDALTLKFEDLLHRPREVLGSICGFLGVPFAEVLLRGTANPKMSGEHRREFLDRRRAVPPDIGVPYFSAILPGLEYCGYLE